MEDVIFGGTETRRPHGYCEVTLNINNTDRSLNFDNDFVSITRRFYRSHESEYLINNVSVRLKDVHELFMDTGLGREGYSVIGQGKIAEVLSQKDDDNNVIYVGDNYMYMIANPESQKETNERSAKSRAEGKLMDGIPDNESFVLVFDYNLNLLKKYKVDSNIRHLVLTPENSIVYALDYRENRLKKYTLPGLE